MEEQLSLFGDPVPVCRYLVVTYCDDSKYDDKKEPDPTSMQSEIRFSGHLYIISFKTMTC